jgi:hypothetical protein
MEIPPDVTLFHSRWGASISGKKRQYSTDSNTAFGVLKRGWVSAAALALLVGAAGAAATAGAEIDAAIEFEAVHMKINLYGLCTFEELFVDDIFVAVHVKLFVSVVGLIQSHGQAGSASAAFVQKDSHRANILVAKIGRDLFGGRSCNFEHGILLRNY